MKCTVMKCKVTFYVLGPSGAVFNILYSEVWCVTSVCSAEVLDIWNSKLKKTDFSKISQ